MKKMNNRKGFTLAELLIVVAIIAVLVAIAIPIFTTQLERAREATDLANVRSAYAEVVTAYLGNGSATSATVSVNQKMSGWQINNGGSAYIGTPFTVGSKSVGGYKVPAKKSGSYTVSISADGTVTVG